MLLLSLAALGAWPPAVCYAGQSVEAATDCGCGILTKKQLSTDIPEVSKGRWQLRKELEGICKSSAKQHCQLLVKILV